MIIRLFSLSYCPPTGTVNNLPHKQTWSLDKTRRQPWVFLSIQTCLRKETWSCRRPSRRAHQNPSPVNWTCRLQLPCLSWQGAVPLPPDEPYDSFLIRMGRTKRDSTSSAPQPAAAVPLQELVTLPAVLSQPFPTLKGPVMTPRAPSSTPSTCILLPGRCYVPPPQPWSWPGQAVLALNMHLCQQVPPPPGPGVTVDIFLSFVGGLPPPQPQQMTTVSTVQTPSSYSPTLSRIFSSSYPALSTGPAGPAPAQPQSGLTSELPIPLPPASAASIAAP